MNPLVSIIMPTYNCAQFISEAINSVLAQEYKEYELIVVDDGSTDKTESVLKQYAGKLTYIRQANAGPSAARNQGIEKARGEILAFLDSDDIWYPDRLKKSVGFLLEHPQVKMVSSDVDFFDETGVVLKNQIRTEKTVYEGNVYDRLFVENYISTITVTFWKECLERAGVFDPLFRYGEEYDLWMRIAHFFRYAFIPISLAGYRLRAGSLVSDYDGFLETRLKIIAKHVRLYPEFFQSHSALIKRSEENLFYRYGYNYFSTNRMSRARECFLRGIYRRPGRVKAYAYLAASFLPISILNKTRTGN